MAMVWDDDRRAEVLPQRTREGDAVEFHFSLFLLMSEARTSLEIFDLAGRAVRQPEELPQRAGPQQLTWNGRDEAGHLVVPGLYPYGLSVAGDAGTNRRLGTVAVVY